MQEHTSIIHIFSIFVARRPTYVRLALWFLHHPAWVKGHTGGSRLTPAVGGLCIVRAQCTTGIRATRTYPHVNINPSQHFPQFFLKKVFFLFFFFLFLFLFFFFFCLFFIFFGVCFFVCVRVFCSRKKIFFFINFVFCLISLFFFLFFDLDCFAFFEYLFLRGNM